MHSIPLIVKMLIPIQSLHIPIEHLHPGVEIVHIFLHNLATHGITQGQQIEWHQFLQIVQQMETYPSFSLIIGHIYHSLVMFFAGYFLQDLVLAIFDPAVYLVLVLAWYLVLKVVGVWSWDVYAQLFVAHQAETCTAGVDY